MAAEAELSTHSLVPSSMTFRMLQSSTVSQLITDEIQAPAPARFGDVIGNRVYATPFLRLFSRIARPSSRYTR